VALSTRNIPDSMIDAIEFDQPGHRITGPVRPEPWLVAAIREHGHPAHDALRPGDGLRRTQANRGARASPRVATRKES